MNALHRPAAALVLLSLLSACAGSRPQSWSSTDPYLEHANTKLDGRRAWLQLADGREVENAMRVSMGPEVVRWQIDGRAFEAPTESVLRVGIEPKERVGRQLAALVVVLGVLGFAGGSLGSAHDSPAAREEQDRFERSALGRALAPLPGEIVYEARPARRLPASPAGGSSNA